MTPREMLLKKIGTYQFAIADMNLFLDTHPWDKASLMKRDEYQRELMPLVKEYEKEYGPLTKRVSDNNTWAWVKDPWPWNTEDDV
ncbi:MAG: spore coat protein CotJB [Ruminococcus sp.]|nr:spore coat protein CotJB [Ruminococcus sp.]